MEPAPDQPLAPPEPAKNAVYLFNIVKYHAFQTGVLAVAALLLGLIQQVAEFVSGFWWVLLFSVPMCAFPAFKVMRDESFLDTHELPAYIVYTLGHFATWCVLCGFLGRPLLMVACFVFVGLLIQQTYVQGAPEITTKSALGLPLVGITLMWACAEVAVLPTWSFLWMILVSCKVQSVCVAAAAVYILAFTVACSHMSADRGLRETTLTLGGEAMMLWKYYLTIFHSVAGRVGEQSQHAQ